jgi:hypothetical protein
LSFIASRGQSIGSNANFFGIYTNSISSRNYNPIVQRGDHVIMTGVYGTGSAVSGGIVIAPWARSKSGLRMDNTGNITIYGNDYTPSTSTSTGASLSFSNLRWDQQHVSPFRA